MRLLKLLVSGVLAILAVIVALVATIVAALTGAAIMLTRRSLKRSQPAASAAPGRVPRARAAPADAIDVVATEVPAEPPSTR